MSKVMLGQGSHEIDAGKLVVINKLTPWFNAKLHSPSPVGWYDGRECNARNNLRVKFRRGNKKSLCSVNVTNYQRHWRAVKGEILLQPAAGSKLSVRTSQRKSPLANGPSKTFWRWQWARLLIDMKQ